ncbi:MAG: glycosyltransferase family 2 protein [Streptosporangiaceae bacterium]
MSAVKRDVSVIICTHDSARWHDLLDAVRSVDAQGLRGVETIVVVDHNPDMLRRVRSEFPHVHSLANDGVRGASAARNEGARAATGELLAFLDDDAVARPGWLEHLTDPYENLAVIGVGGGLEPLWLRGRPYWFPEEFGWVVGVSYRGLPRTGGPVRNVWTTNMSVRRVVFDAAGGFREGFGKTGSRSAPEDTDFCLRARRAWPGSIWLHEPTAVAAHKVPPSRSNLRFFLTRCYVEGRGKAELARLVGHQEGMSTERTHARTLPAAAARELGDALLGRSGAYARAATIVAGLAAASAGFAAESVRTRGAGIPRPAPASGARTDIPAGR